MQRKLCGRKTIKYSSTKKRVVGPWKQIEIRTAFKTVLIKIYKVTDSLIFSIFTCKPQKFESGTWEKNDKGNIRNYVLSSLKLCNVHREVTVLKYLFTNCRPWACSSIKKRLRHRYFPVMTLYTLNLVSVLVLERFS